MAVQRARHRVHEIMEMAREGDITSRLFDIFIMSLIALNLIAVVLESVPSIDAKYGHLLHNFDLISLYIFTMEYVMRIWGCTADPRYKHPVWGRLRYAVTPMAMIDLLAILPFFIPMILAFDLREIRAVRLFRFFRVFKLVRYSQSLHMLGAVLRDKREELAIICVGEVFMLIFISSVMYHVEHTAQPDKFGSIPQAMWWGVVTLTTVGYGDVAPVTAFGKLCGGVLALSGVALFAIPAGILASGFTSAFKYGRRKNDYICPHCSCDIRYPSRDDKAPMTLWGPDEEDESVDRAA